jgi:hypothetical protein
MKMEREEYWKSEIAFFCPLTKKKHTIEYCFEHCEPGYIYRADESGRSAAYLYCTWVVGERDLLSGKATRDN